MIDVTHLKDTPFSLPWGASVYAKLFATNIKGTSTVSNVGNGAIIVTYADPPINFVEDWSVKAPTTIGLSWDEAPFNGGAVVEDYQISISSDGQAYSILVTGHTSKTFAATGLTEGVTYSFYVQSRNQHGYSQNSEVLTVLSAYIPEPPTVVTTANFNDHIIVDWNDPDFNGSPITSYSVFVLQHDGVTYT